ncbi:MAG: hypothetical protein V3V33_16010 [Candidatus Lokiarchaeia archaeon]
MSEEAPETRTYVTLMLSYDVGLEKLLDTDLESEGIKIAYFNTQGSRIASADETIPEGIFVFRRTSGDKFYMSPQTIELNRVNTLANIKESFRKIRERALSTDDTFPGRIYLNEVGLVDIGDDMREPRIVMFTKNIHLKEDSLRRLLIGKSQMPLDASEVYNTYKTSVDKWVQSGFPNGTPPPRIEASDVIHYAPNIFNSSLTIVRKCIGVIKDNRYFEAETCEEVLKEEIEE